MAAVNPFIYGEVVSDAMFADRVEERARLEKDLLDGQKVFLNLEDLHRTLTRLLNEQHTVFEEAWQRLTLAQRAVLRALVLENGREILSAGVRTRHRLAGPSSVQAALAALMRLDLVMKEGSQYVVSDSLYREWIARRTS